MADGERKVSFHTLARPHSASPFGEAPPLAQLPAPQMKDSEKKVTFLTSCSPSSPFGEMRDAFDNTGSACLRTSFRGMSMKMERLRERNISIAVRPHPGWHPQHPHRHLGGCPAHLGRPAPPPHRAASIGVLPNCPTRSGG